MSARSRIPLVLVLAAVAVCAAAVPADAQFSYDTLMVTDTTSGPRRSRSARTASRT
jgi:hypothetical protein